MDDRYKKLLKNKIRLLSILLFVFNSAPAHALRPFGLNEGIGSIPIKLLKNTTPEQIQIMSRKNAGLASAIGVKSYRKHCADMPTSFAQNNIPKTPTGYDFLRQDAFVQAIQEFKIDLLVTLAPYWQCNPPLFSLIPDGSSYYPKDEAAFQDYIMAVVERYDGDGYLDMPGLKYPIKHWQLDNEVDGKETALIGPNRSRTTWITPESYIRLLRLTRSAIKKSDEDAELVPSFLILTRHQIPNNVSFFKSFIELGGEDLVDAIDFHEYNYNLNTFQKSITLVKSLIKNNTPLWILETSVPSNSDALPGFDLTKHSRAVIKLHVTAFAAGIEKVFWHTLRDGPPYPSPDWKSFGTNSFYSCDIENKTVQQDIKYCTSYTMKPAAYTYKLMTEHLDGFTSAKRIRDDIYLFSFKSKHPIVVAWTDSPSQIDVRNLLEATQVKVTHIVENSGEKLPQIRKALAERVSINQSPVFIQKQTDE